HGESLPAMCISIAADTPEPLAKIRPDVPAALEAVILHCLEKDMTRRIQSVAELAHGLAPFGSLDARGSVERIARVSRSGAASTLSGLHPLPIEPVLPDAFLEVNTIPTPGPEVATATGQPSVVSQTRAPGRRRPALFFLAAGGALVVIGIGAFVSRGGVGAPAGEASVV